MLRDAVHFLLARMPADGGGVEEDLGALKGGQSRALGIPSIPTDQHADLRVLRLPASETGVARREVELLVIKRIVGDVHLAVDAQDRSVRVDDGRRVVIQAGRALFEK